VQADIPRRFRKILAGQHGEVKGLLIGGVEHVSCRCQTSAIKTTSQHGQSSSP
jgi:hypothetical protein